MNRHETTHLTFLSTYLLSYCKPQGVTPLLTTDNTAVTVQ